ncbi:unnamed protein product [Kuraishia capsulata CBS 1993]|uniref:CCR4-Not complex 3'-5'-exoribonuclease subunit Ccr4 n=1 Tax=Kuraishia capsulata CBS 1993 TaxID=1382522 RepID=W6MSA7_9ASCO|nr:uncharacterized protein KUCA_T00005572001 [Kuraishia capsulata CBS 1993]CDK29579.1 unnamed protein product [Kuraishia capsulata CBS 1993]
MNVASQFKHGQSGSDQSQQQLQSQHILQQLQQQQGQPIYSSLDGYGSQPQQRESVLNPASALAQTIYQNQFRSNQVQPQGNASQQGQSQIQSLNQQLQQQLQQQQHQQQQQQPGTPQSHVLGLAQQLRPNDRAHASIDMDASLASSVHWQHQVQLAQLSRNSSVPHFYARQAAASSRKALNGTSVLETKSNSLVEQTKSLLSSVPEDVEQTNGETNRNPLLQHKKLTNDTIDDDEEEQRIRLQENNKQLWTSLDLSGQDLMNVSPKLFNYEFLSKLYLNGNKLRFVPPAISKLKSLRMVDLSQNQLTEFPSELGTLFNLRYLYAFDNNLTTVPYEFGKLFSLEFLGIEGNTAMNPDFLRILASKGTKGLVVHLRDTAPPPSPPKKRPWITLGDDGEPVDQGEIDVTESSNAFTVMSYNTLCQHYATPSMYKFVPSWALNWEYRRDHLTKEVMSVGTDIICLQEVESRTYDEYWVPLMEKAGYKGVFYCKSRARTMSEKGAKKVDGCATFYKTSKFELSEKKLLEYGYIVMGQDKFKKTEDVFNRFMNKDNIGAVLVLTHISTDTKIIVVNTHLHWDPAFNDVKTLQVGVLLDELQQMTKRLAKYGPPSEMQKIPLVVCGDLNSQTNSAVYQLFSQGTVKEHSDIEGRDYGKFTEEGFSHPFHFSSAYNSIGELPFTNLSPTFTDVIDYIWYTTPTLVVKGLLGQVDPDYLKNVIGLPDPEIPSDHIPLVVKFEIKKSKDKKTDGFKADFKSISNSSRKI